jgi:hypothetical protein
MAIAFKTVVNAPAGVKKDIMAIGVNNHVIPAAKTFAIRKDTAGFAIQENMVICARFNVQKSVRIMSATKQLANAYKVVILAGSNLNAIRHVQMDVRRTVTALAIVWYHVTTKILKDSNVKTAETQ